MKPKSALRSFLALTGSSLLAISYSHGQTILADDYLTSLNVASNTTLFSSLNFNSILDGPLTGSSDLTLTGYFGNQLSLVSNGTSNTFDGNIIIDAGILRIAGNPFTTSGGGFVAGSMTAADTITVNRAGTFTIDDNIAGGYTANRFGTSGDRPAVNLAGGTINLNGLNNATSSVQTFGALNVSSGQGRINVTKNSNGTPTLTFDSLSISKGATVFFNGTSLGTSSKITFATAPTLTGGIIAGAQWWDGGNATNNLVTYDGNGVRQLVTADYTDVATDINAVAAAANVRVTSTTTAAAALTADKTVNSLTINGGSWNMTNKLTITSGMFNRKGGANAAVNITSGTLTAGNGTDDIDLHIINTVQATTFSGTSVIADNGDTAVTLVKTGTTSRNLNLTSNSNNTYTGGTYLLDGTVVTGTTANRTYLGTGKVTVDGVATILTLGAIGATSNASGDDFTAKNGGTITLSSGNHGTVDTFNIGANSIISGGSASNSGLASLTRGTNITLAAGAIIGHAIRGSALSLTTGTIQNLGTNADLYYGFYANQNNALGAVTIGSGTAFRGISTDRSAKSWEQGTINIASSTTSVDFQGLATYGAAATLTLGNGAGGGAPVITSAVTGTVDINAIGALTLNDSTATFGNTGSGQNIRFVSTAGSTLTVTAATGMGSSTGIASAIVKDGGRLAIGNTAALNGAVTVEGGGRLTASQALGLTGAGALTFAEGSILEITNATGFSGAQATAATVAAGTIVRVAVNNPGTAAVTLDSILGSYSPIYQLTGSDVDVPEPSSLATTMTLNKNGSGVGGILTNGLASTYFRNNANGQVTIGANGGVMAATTNTELQVQENIVGTGVTLTFGTTDVIDGAPKRGSVALGSAAGSNTYTGQNIIAAGSVRTGYNDVLGATTNQITINTGGTLNVNGTSQTVGNFTGTGGFVTLGNGTLIIGQGDNGGGNYQGSIQGASGKLTKTGTGTITLSGANTYTGVTTVSGGVLKLNNATALSGGIANTGGTSALTINGGGVVGLANGDFTRGIGTGVTQFQFTGTGGGFAAYGADRTVTPGTLAFGATAGTHIIGTLTLGAADADSTLIWSSSISFGGSQRTVQVNDGSAAVDGRLSGKLTGGTSSGIDKTGAGTLEITNTTNDYTGATTVSNGTLRLGANDVLPNTTNVTIAATLEVGAGFTDTVGTLDVTAAATINLGAVAKLTFAASNAVDWTGGTLNITGFVSGSSLNFGSAAGLTDDQLLKISATGFTGFDLDAEGDLIATPTGGGSAYDTWAATFLPGNDVSNSAGDNDNDGNNNLSEFAFDGNPLSGANDGKIVGKIATVGGDQVLTLTLPVRNGAAFANDSGDQLSGLTDGIYYRVEGGTDLVTFAETITEVTGADATAIQTGLPALATGWTYRTFRTSGTVSSATKKFIRAKVSETP